MTQANQKPKLLDQVRAAIRTIQELAWHGDVKTTIIYTHVLNKSGRGVRISADLLQRGCYVSRVRDSVKHSI